MTARVICCRAVRAFGHDFFTALRRAGALSFDFYQWPSATEELLHYEITNFLKWK